MNDPPVNDLDMIYVATLENRRLLQEILVRLEAIEGGSDEPPAEEVTT